VGYIRYHFHENLDNLRLLDEGQAIDELRLYKQAGGKTITDATTVDLGRNPSVLQRISQSTGLNIIMGSGYFVKAVQNLKIMDKRTEEDIAEEIVKDVLKGTDGTDIHSGMIGEIGCTYPLEDCEKKILRAAGMAQKETGAPLEVHPGRSEEALAKSSKYLKRLGRIFTTRNLPCRTDVL
jgi:phosphotriesterase-related protein